MPELSEFAAAAVIVTAGALAQGFLGFGFAIVAMIGLTLSRDLLHAAGVVNLTGILVAGSVLMALRRESKSPFLSSIHSVYGSIIGGFTIFRAANPTFRPVTNTVATAAARNGFIALENTDV